MTEPDPTYHPNGEQLPASTIETLRRHALGVRSDGISQVEQSERILEALGYPVESAIVTRRERRLTKRTVRK